MGRQDLAGPADITNMHLAQGDRPIAQSDADRLLVFFSIKEELPQEGISPHLRLILKRKAEPYALVEGRGGAEEEGQAIVLFGPGFFDFSCEGGEHLFDHLFKAAGRGFLFQIKEEAALFPSEGEGLFFFPLRDVEVKAEHLRVRGR